jgi:DNA-binding transcriptional MerR regulator
MKDGTGPGAGGLSRSEAAELLGIGASTILYYERIGLIEEPRRSASGYRVYMGEDLAKLRLVARAKELGFALREIAALVRGLAGGRSRSELRAGLLGKAGELEAEIASLEARRRAVLEMAESPLLGECETLRAVGKSIRGP